MFERSVSTIPSLINVEVFLVVVVVVVVIVAVIGVAIVVVAVTADFHHQWQQRRFYSSHVFIRFPWMAIEKERAKK